MSDRSTTQFERRVGFILQVGSIASTALLAAGLVVSFAVSDRPLAPSLLSGGLIILMATPAARVVMSIIEYARERDWVFVGLTSMVLLVLLGSLLVATAS